MVAHDKLLDEALGALRRAGPEPDRAVLGRVKDLGPAVIPPLIAMATDQTLHDADQDSPDVWAPLHAIQILGEIGAAEAVEPLIPLLSREDDDYLAEILPECFGRIGKPALAPLRAFLQDRSQGVWARGTAAHALKEIAERHPDLRSEAIAALVSRLDPAESQTADDETLNGLVISDLLDIKAAEALPAIRQAFDDDRVDRRIVRPDDVRRDLGQAIGPREPRTRSEKGLRLWLKCTACGYAREHHIEKMYYDLGTMDRRAKGEQTPYSEVVMPQRITCPKCGAVDQYELTSEALISLTANLLTRAIEVEKRRSAVSDDTGPVIYRRFTLADGREMHPYEARDMYRRQVEADPGRADLRLGYAKTLKFLGYRDEAVQQYQAALRLNPTDLEAYVDLGLLAREAGDRTEARRLFGRVLELAPASRLSRRERQDYVDFAQEQLAELNAGRPGMSRPVQQASRHAVAAAPARQAAMRAGKVGRNDPCPCGSGKKYKKCCGA